MPNSARIAAATLDTPSSGTIELTRDWTLQHLPPIRLESSPKSLIPLTRLPLHEFARNSAYYIDDNNRITFLLFPALHPQLIDLDNPTLFLAGNINNWCPNNSHNWRLHRTNIDNTLAYTWTGDATPFLEPHHANFKFITSENLWLKVPNSAPNITRDSDGNANYTINPDRTGRHLFRFTLPAAPDLSTNINLTWSHSSSKTQTLPVRPGAFFHDLATDLPLGALPDGDTTTFRIFAPRASSVILNLSKTPTTKTPQEKIPLTRHTDNITWQTTIDNNLHGWFYWYNIDGPQNPFSAFNPEQPILDPYALATVSHAGPGIVIDKKNLPRPRNNFTPPEWQNLVIAEAHLRDLNARAPLDLSPRERLTFAGLAKYVQHPDFYPAKLGINALELQPLQQFDNQTRDEYHWGYMPVNYFAPADAYSTDPENASGITELQQLSSALHRRGIALILDVVYNHTGNPNHLLAIDKLYYFEQDNDGNLSNWSGCGNDLRASSAMATRLIIDSLSHLVQTCHIDGFRFDLADLLGKPVLSAIEAALKKIKPGIILIAEPWSFRGHIAAELRDTGWASWNDGYRNFIRDYILGNSTADTLEYFLKGSPWHFAKWPAQTINYASSHDDRCWLDLITTNPDHNGNSPSPLDRRRTHLMAALLNMSIGIPMLASGQDLLASKHGTNNTYLRGDLNTLEYTRAQRYPATHTYFADWIAFRLSDAGKLLRHYARASENFFKFFTNGTTSAALVLYNADHSQGPQQLLFAINPTPHDTLIDIGDAAHSNWRQIADHEHFHSNPPRGLTHPVTPTLFLPAISCALWINEQ